MEVGESGPAGNCSLQAHGGCHNPISPTVTQTHSRPTRELQTSSPLGNGDPEQPPLETQSHLPPTVPPPPTLSAAPLRATPAPLLYVYITEPDRTTRGRRRGGARRGEARRGEGAVLAGGAPSAGGERERGARAPLGSSPLPPPPSELGTPLRV